MKAIVPHEIEEYAAAHSAAPDALLDELERYTRAHCEMPQMLVGALEGGLLRMLVAATGARHVLEIGTFTGYSALSMAAALPEDGTLTTCEIDEDRATIAQSFFDRSPCGGRITLRRGPALETLATLSGPFDFVFLDADKKSYVDYYEACLPLLRHGGIIAVDNVLWSGRVLEPKEESDRAIARFNTHVQGDPRTEVVMLTVRDGLSLIRKLYEESHLDDEHQSRVGAGSPPSDPSPASRVRRSPERTDGGQPEAAIGYLPFLSNLFEIS